MQLQSSQEITATQQSPTALRWYRYGIGAGLALCCLLVYRFAFTGGFLNWDDLNMVVGNERFLNPSIENLARFWTEYKTGFLALYTPMAYSAWWGLARLFGVQNAAPFHTANVVMHTANVLLAFGILVRLLRTRFDEVRALAGAGIGAVLFAVHPLQVEPVSWVSGFNNLIGATFGFYALMRFIDFLNATTRRQAAEAYTFATLGLLLGFFSKPTALVIPLMAGVLGILFFGARWRRVALGLLPWAMLMVPFVVIGQRVQDASWMGYGVRHRPLIVADTVAFYWGKVIAPTKIMADYGRTPQVVIETWRSQPIWLFAVALSLGAAWWWRKFRWLGAAIVLSLAAIAPTSGIIPFFFQSYSTVADRYFYLGVLGPALVLAAVVAMWPLRRTLYIAAGALLLLACLTVQLSVPWRSTYSWSNALLERNPKSVIGNMTLGCTYAKDGDYERARPLINAGLAQAPHHSRVLLAASLYSLDAKQPGDALAYLMFLLKQQPQYTEAYHLLTLAATRNHTTDLGIMAMEGVISACPGQAEAHAQLGILYGSSGQYEKAYNQLWTALQINPNEEAALRGMKQLETELAAKKRAAKQKPAENGKQ